MVGQVCCFGPEERQNITSERHGEGALSHSWRPGSRERGEGGCREDEPFQGMTSHPVSDPPLPATHHLPAFTTQLVHSNKDGLIRSQLS